jgi:hypothetical protein
LRRALKIKSSVFILAWLTLLAHNAIPHNHAHEHFVTFSHSAHDPVSCNENEVLSAKVDRGHCSEHICSSLNLLFYTLNPELFIANSHRDLNFYPGWAESETFLSSNDSFTPCNLKGTSFLRAPPLS